MAKKKTAEPIQEQVVEQPADALADPEIQAAIETAKKQMPTNPLAKVFKEAEAEEDTSQNTNTEATEGDEEPQLSDQLAELTQQYGLPAHVLEGCESLAEAERTIERLYWVLYREGQQGAAMPPPAQQQQAAPQTKEELIAELSLEDYDPDDLTAKNFKTLKGLFDKQQKELQEWRQAREYDQYTQFQRAQQQAAAEFQQALRETAPNLFGAEKQDFRQREREREAFEAGDILIRGMASRGLPVASYKTLAEQVVRMKFGGEADKQQAKREAVEKRQSMRSLGAPAHAARQVGQTATKVFQGPMEDDPELQNLVNSFYQKRA